MADTDTTRVVLRAMGTDVTVVAEGAVPGDVEASTAELLERLEAQWSRFRPTSELSRLNAANGSWVVVSPDTFELVARAVDAWRDTAGCFDPTVLPALIAAGYDRDFTQITSSSSSSSSSSPPPSSPAPAAPPPPPPPPPPSSSGPSRSPAPGCGGIELDPTVGAIRLPVGVALDLGGIGKGRAADLLARTVLGLGARGVLADLGGDVRVMGEPPRDEGWLLDVDDPLHTGATGRLSLRGGAVATSTRLRRAWSKGGQPQHHLIDPRTGAPAMTGLASVTVVAGSACRAEVLAKAAFVAGPDDGAALLAAAKVTGLLVHDDGRVEDLPGLEPFRS